MNHADGVLPNDPTDAVTRVDGGYVDVPFSADLNTNKFTVIAWVSTECRSWCSVHGPPGSFCVACSKHSAARL